MRHLLSAVLLGWLAWLSGAAHARGELHIYNWNNYIAPSSIAAFEKSCDCRVVYDTYGSNDELLAKLAAGATGYDILVPTGNALQVLIKQNALRPLDKAKIPALKNIKPNYLNTRFDPGNRYSVPYAFTVTLLGFNEAKLRELGVPTDTWAAIFDPKHLRKMKGRVTVLDDQRELMGAALRYLGHSANDTDPAHWRAAREVIARAKPYWAAFNNTSYIRLLAAGDVWLAHGYSNDFYQANLEAGRAGKGLRIGFRVPKEGAVFALDSMVIHKNAPRPDLAHRFINFMLQGEESAKLSNLIGSGNPNAAATAYIKPEIAGNEAIFPGPQAASRLEMLIDLNPRQRRQLNRLWTDIKLR